jgi:hypothetical protein
MEEDNTWMNINGTPKLGMQSYFNISIFWQKTIIMVICFNGNKVL